MTPGPDDILPLLPVDDLAAPELAGRTAAWLAVRLRCSPPVVRAELERMELRGQVQRSRKGSGSWLWARCPE